MDVGDHPMHQSGTRLQAVAAENTVNTVSDCGGGPRQPGNLGLENYCDM